MDTKTQTLEHLLLRFIAVDSCFDLVFLCRAINWRWNSPPLEMCKIVNLVKDEIWWKFVKIVKFGQQAEMWNLFVALVWIWWLEIQHFNNIQLQPGKLFWEHPSHHSFLLTLWSLWWSLLFLSSQILALLQVWSWHLVLDCHGTSSVLGAKSADNSKAASRTLPNSSNSVGVNGDVWSSTDVIRSCAVRMSSFSCCGPSSSFSTSSAPSLLMRFFSGSDIHFLIKHFIQDVWGVCNTEKREYLFPSWIFNLFSWWETQFGWCQRLFWCLLPPLDVGVPSDVLILLRLFGGWWTVHVHLFGPVVVTFWILNFRQTVKSLQFLNFPPQRLGSAQACNATMWFRGN